MKIEEKYKQEIREHLERASREADAVLVGGPGAAAINERYKAIFQKINAALDDDDIEALEVAYDEFSRFTNEFQRAAEAKLRAMNKRGRPRCAPRSS
jgi:hypothetical protein